MKKARKTSAKRSQRGHPAVVPKHQLAPPGPEAADDNQGSKTASRHPLIYEGFVSQELAAREAQRPPPAGAETSPLVVQAFPAPHAQNCGPRLVGNDAPDVSLSTGEGLPDASTVQPPQELQQKSYGALRSPGQLKCPPKSITPKHIMSMCRMNLQELEVFPNAFSRRRCNADRSSRTASPVLRPLILLTWSRVRLPRSINKRSTVPVFLSRS